MFDYLNSTAGTVRSEQSSNSHKTKKEFKDQKLTGLFQRCHPQTGEIKEEGKFRNGQEVGLWKEIDDDGD